MTCPAGQASYADSDHFVVCIPLRVGLPMVGTKLDPDQREGHLKGYTRHEVAARIGVPQTRLSFVG